MIQGTIRQLGLAVAIGHRTAEHLANPQRFGHQHRRLICAADFREVTRWIESGRDGVSKPRDERRGVTAVANEGAGSLRLGFVADDEEAPVRVLGGLRRRGARFLVMHFAVNHRREAVLRVTPHVLPDVQDRAARRVDERAALPLELRQLADRDAERRQNHDVVRTERGTVFARVGKDVNPFFAEAVVDVRVVDDLAGQQHALRGEFLPSLVRVIDRAVHAVAEPEFLRQVERETSARLNEPGCLEVVDDAAVVGSSQVGCDRFFEVETLTEDDRGHDQPPILRPIAPVPTTPGS